MIFHFCGNNGYCMVLEIERSFLLDKFIYIEKLLKLSILKFPKQPEFGKFSIVMNNHLSLLQNHPSALGIIAAFAFFALI